MMLIVENDLEAKALNCLNHDTHDFMISMMPIVGNDLEAKASHHGNPLIMGIMVRTNAKCVSGKSIQSCES